MKLRLICEYKKNDYGDVFDNIKEVIIEKEDNKKVLRIVFSNNQEDLVIYIKDIRLAYLFDYDSLYEFFRIEN